MSNSLLAAALSAITNNTVITYDDFVEKKFGDLIQYHELDQNSLHQSHLVGGKLPTSVTLPEPIKYNSNTKSHLVVPRSFELLNPSKSLGGGQIFVRILTGKTVTLEVELSMKVE